MSKRIAVASGRWWKLCAIGFGVATFSNAATAQYHNSADVYGYPFGLSSTLDHQIKAWNSHAMQDAQDAIFYYADAIPATNDVETVISSAQSTARTADPIAPMPVAVPLPEKTTTGKASARTTKPEPVALASAKSTNDAPPVASKRTMTQAEKAAVVQGIIKQYSAKGIDADAAVSLLADLLDAKANAPLPPAASPALVAAASPAAVTAPARQAAPALRVVEAPVLHVVAAPVVQSWPVRANATVQDTLAAWATTAGWKTPQWNAALPYRIVDGAQIEGSFFDALRVLAAAVPQININASVARHELVISDARP